jgi:arylsulfatase A-like enzyme
VAEPAQGIDLCTTALGVLGIAAPPGLPGQDLLTAIAVRDVVSETASALAPDGSAMDLASLRTPTWKLIDAPSLPRRELYDLGRDPGERHDRWGAAGDGEALRERLDRFRATAPQPPRAERDDPALDEKLRTLGYIE